MAERVQRLGRRRRVGSRTARRRRRSPAPGRARPRGRRSAAAAAAPPRPASSRQRRARARAPTGQRGDERRRRDDRPRAPSSADADESAAFWPTVSEAETSRSPIAPGPARRSAVLVLLVVLDPDPLGGQPRLDPVVGRAAPRRCRARSRRGRRSAPPAARRCRRRPSGARPPALPAPPRSRHRDDPCARRASVCLPRVGPPPVAGRRPSAAPPMTDRTRSGGLSRRPSPAPAPSSPDRRPRRSARRRGGSRRPPPGRRSPRPTTVYWPSRCGAGANMMKNWLLAEFGSAERAMPTVPVSKGSSENSAGRSGRSEPPVPARPSREGVAGAELRRRRSAP